MRANQHPEDEPTPEPLRFYGTSWVDHTGGYALRRICLGLGAVLAAVLGAFLLRFAYEGVLIAGTGGWIEVLLVVAFAACSAMAFSRTLGSYTRRPDPKDASADSSMRSIRLIGFVGVFFAYAVRTVVEAPGEKLARAEYEEAVARYQRRRASRTGNPAAAKRRRSKRR